MTKEQIEILKKLVRKNAEDIIKILENYETQEIR